MRVAWGSAPAARALSQCLGKTWLSDLLARLYVTRLCKEHFLTMLFSYLPAALGLHPELYHRHLKVSKGLFRDLAIKVLF